MPLLPNMKAFQLGQPLDVGRNINYIGGLDDPISTSSIGPSGPSWAPEYADFTDSDSTSSIGPSPEYADFTKSRTNSDSDDED